MLTSKFKVAQKAFPTLKPFLSLPSLASSICPWSKMLRANSGECHLLSTPMIHAPLVNFRRHMEGMSLMALKFVLLI